MAEVQRVGFRPLREVTLGRNINIFNGEFGAEAAPKMVYSRNRADGLKWPKAELGRNAKRVRI